jgi:putative PEP-CTERM system histidine kinase
MLAFVGQWSHAIAAILFGAFALWNARHITGDTQLRALVVAALLTAFWALAVAMNGSFALISLIAEHCRNLGWLAYMFLLWRQGTGDKRGRSIAVLYLAVGVVIFCCSIGDAVSHGFDGTPHAGDASFFVLTLLRIMTSIAALMLVHNMYTAATPDARATLRLPMVALAAMWSYDLNLYTIAYLTRAWSVELLELRGIALALIALVIALATHRDGKIQVSLSRTITFQSLSLVAIGAYLMLMVVVTSALQIVGGELARMIQIGFIFLASVSGLVLLPSAKFRAWFRVKISKHFFQHRYDYRAEWLRFTDTLGHPGDAGETLEARVIKAIADITESPGGLLLVPDEGGALVPQARWNWRSLDLPSRAQIDNPVAVFGDLRRVIELDSERAAQDANGSIARHLPLWLLDAPDAWAVVPLVHYDRPAGAVVLARPAINRTLDWEDFDLLRVAGRQVASYLVEARGQEALSEAKRFDEFNRRFAFIMHDIKNLVSQLSLVTRNAERHADNPEFRADMIATLQSSTARMNDLLARLSQHNKGRNEEPRATLAFPLVDQIVQAQRSRHPVLVSGDSNLRVIADPARLEQAVSHLVQNAIDASSAMDPVIVMIKNIDDEIHIEVIDKGEGMSQTFIREKLFKPFASTKDGGFGIGAFEARSLIVAMGGRLDVASREGEGTRFTIMLPADLSEAHYFTSTEAQAA